MPTIKLSAPKTKNVSLTTAYLVDTYVARGGKQLQITTSTAGTVAYTVKYWDKYGDENIETVLAGSSPFFLPLTTGADIYFTILAASGTPMGYITVS